MFARPASSPARRASAPGSHQPEQQPMDMPERYRGSPAPSASAPAAQVGAIVLFNGIQILRRNGSGV
jgi:hypothetical protein